MAKRQVAKVTDYGDWRIYLQDGRYRIYHEYWDGKWHNKQAESGVSFGTLAEALHEMATLIENDHFLRTLASRFSHT